MITSFTIASIVLEIIIDAAISATVAGINIRQNQALVNQQIESDRRITNEYINQIRASDEQETAQDNSDFRLQNKYNSDLF